MKYLFSKLFISFTLPLLTIFFCSCNKEQEANVESTLVVKEVAAASAEPSFTAGSKAIDFTLIDVKKTNTVESTKRVLLFPQNLMKPFLLSYAPKSSMNSSTLTIYNVIVAFDKGAAYDPNLATRLGKAFVKMSEFKNDTKKEKEAY